MSKITNPLLIALRSSGIEIDCYRAYSSVYKDGRFRVKFYGCNRIRSQISVLGDMRRALVRQGFVDIDIQTPSEMRRLGPSSLIIRAVKV